MTSALGGLSSRRPELRVRGHNGRSSGWLPATTASANKCLCCGDRAGFVLDPGGSSPRRGRCSWPPGSSVYMGIVDAVEWWYGGLNTDIFIKWMLLICLCFWNRAKSYLGRRCFWQREIISCSQTKYTWLKSGRVSAILERSEKKFILTKLLPHSKFILATHRLRAPYGSQGPGFRRRMIKKLKSVSRQGAMWVNI